MNTFKYTRLSGAIQSIYLISSLRNPEVVKLGNALRKHKFEVFDDWAAAGKIADDCWQAYENARGRNYVDALKGYAAQHVFSFDRQHLERCDAVVLVLPAGKSGHLELGWALGRGKRGYIFMQEEPPRYDVMYNFATGVFFDLKDLVRELKARGIPF